MVRWTIKAQEGIDGNKKNTKMKYLPLEFSWASYRNIIIGTNRRIPPTSAASLESLKHVESAIVKPMFERQKKIETSMNSRLLLSVST